MKVYCDPNGNPIDFHGNIIPCDQSGDPISRVCAFCETLEANTVDGFWNTNPPTCEDCIFHEISKTTF